MMNVIIQVEPVYFNSVDPDQTLLAVTHNIYTM